MESEPGTWAYIGFVLSVIALAISIAGFFIRLSHLEGGFDQMDKRMSDLSARMSNAESLQRWAIGLIITSWLTLVGLSITMLFKMP